MHFHAFTDEMTKIAMAGELRARLVRLGLTDVPWTPRMIMRQRSPRELGNIQQRVQSAIHNVQAQPLIDTAEHVVKTLPQKAQPVVRKAVKFTVENPEFVVPGGSGITAAKKGAIKAIDKMVPVPVKS